MASNFDTEFDDYVAKMPKAPKPPTSAPTGLDFDAEVGALLESRGAKAAQNNIAATRMAPEQAAKVHSLARDAGLSPWAVEGNEAQVLMDLTLRKNREIFARDPVMARAAAENSAFTDISFNEMDSAAAISKAWADGGFAPASGVARKLDDRRGAILDQQRNQLKATPRGGFVAETGDALLRGAARASVSKTLIASEFGLYDSTPVERAVQLGQELRRVGARPMPEDVAAGLAEIKEAGKESFGAALAAVVKNPRAVWEVSAESLAASSPSLVAAAVGSVAGPLGTAAGAGVGSFAVEYASTLSEVIGDVNDPMAIAAALEDPEKLKAAREKAVTRGIPIALFDALTAGLAGKLLAGAKATVTSVGTRAAGELGMQALGGGAGEAVAGALTNEFNWGDVLLEAFAEIPSALSEVPSNYGHYASLKAGQQAIDTSTKLQEIISVMEKMKVFEADPKTLESFMQTVSNNTPLFVTADALREMLETGKIDRAKLPSVTDEILSQASNAGPGVEIPAGELLTAFAGTGLGDQMAQHVRRDPNSPTAAEAMAGASTALQGVEDDLRTILQEKMADTVFVQSAEELRQDFEQQLGAASPFGPQYGSGIAKLATAFYVTQAKEWGVTPTQLRDGWTDAAGNKQEALPLYFGREGLVRMPPGFDHGNAMLNVGLTVGLPAEGSQKIDADFVKAELEKMGVQVLSGENVDGEYKDDNGNTVKELTYVPQLSRPLTDDEMMRLTEATRQEAIPQYLKGEGKLHGTPENLAKYGGAFNGEYFKNQKGEALVKAGESFAQKKKKVPEGFAAVKATAKTVGEGNKLGFNAFLRRVVKNAVVKLTKGGKPTPLIVQTTTNANAEEQLTALDTVLEMFPTPEASVDAWNQMSATAYGSTEVPLPPYMFIERMRDAVETYGGLLRKLTPGQVQDANHGFANAASFREMYLAGKIGVETTGKLLLWSFLSRGVSPYIQESMFLDAVEGATPFIDLAAAGKFDATALAKYLEWSATAAAPGAPGRPSTANLNAFGRDFLTKMGRVDAEGKTGIQRFHDMLTSPDLTGPQIRREFLKMGEGVGIDNKIVSFTLLVAGFSDVMVLDRVQLGGLWNDGQFDEYNLYDGVKQDSAPDAEGKVTRVPVPGSGLADLTAGTRGLLQYEAIERALLRQLPEIFAAAGRSEVASLGRFHWETWVAYSNQEASHGTLDALVNSAMGDPTAYYRAVAKEGQYDNYNYGMQYGRDEGGPHFMLEDSAGATYVMSPEQKEEFYKVIRNPKYGVIPRTKRPPPGKLVKDWSKEDWYKVWTTGRDEKGQPRVGPWYNDPRVDRSKLDEYLHKFGKPAEGSRVIRKHGKGAASDGAGRDRPLGGVALREVEADGSAATVDGLQGRGVEEKSSFFQSARAFPPAARGAVAGPVVGVRYTRTAHTSLSSGLFGTGIIKSSEQARVMASSDTRLRHRIAFYVNTGNGIKPEQGVGPTAHTATLENLYDADADVLKIWRNVTDANDRETAVLDAGFDGYLTRSFGDGGAAVMLGQRSVPVARVTPDRTYGVEAFPGEKPAGFEFDGRKSKGGYFLEVSDAGGNYVGNLLVEKSDVQPGYFSVADVNVVAGKQGSGVARAMYREAITALGRPVRPSAVQTPEGKAFWGKVALPVPPAPQYPDAKLQAMRLMEDRTLPSGRLTKSEWQGELTRRGYDLDLSGLNATDRYYKGDVAGSLWQKVGAGETAEGGPSWSTTDRGGVGREVFGPVKQLYHNLKDAELRVGQQRRLNAEREAKLPAGHVMLAVGERSLEKALAALTAAQEQYKGFGNWFKNSRVVDPTGAPLVVYHGTSQDVSVFRRKPNGRALWASDAETAGTYAGAGNIMPVVMSMQNPLEVDAEGATFRELRFEGERLDADDLADIAEARGHDGLIIRNLRDHDTDDGGENPSDHYAVFSPTQIKSAISNTGAFSNEDPRILYQPSPEGALGEFTPRDWEIRFLAQANRSTAFHELGHFFLHATLEMASRPGAPKRIVDDANAILAKAWELKGRGAAGATSFGQKVGAGETALERELKEEEDRFKREMAAARAEAAYRAWTQIPEIREFVDVNVDHENTRGYYPDDSAEYWEGMLQSGQDAVRFRAEEAGVTLPKSVFEVPKNTLYQDPNAQPSDEGLPPLDGRSPIEVWRELTIAEQTEVHEWFAESWEQYIFTGKAPSLELTSLFSKFTRWMKDVYLTMKAFVSRNPRAKLDPELSQIMDRLIATDEEIAEANDARAYTLKFKTAADAGMTDAQFADYLAGSDEQREDAESMLRTRSMRDLSWTSNKRAQLIADAEKANEKLYAEMKAEVTKELANEPINIAIKWLKHGQITRPDGVAVEVTAGNKLNLDDVKALFPEGALGEPVDISKLGYGQYGMVAKDGLAPDLVAEMINENVGRQAFTSGEALVRELLATPKFADQVTALTDSRMIDAHGDLNNADAIAKAADEAIHNDARLRSVATELWALNKNVGSVASIIKAAKEYAKQIIAQRTAKTLKPWQFAAAETRAAKAARTLLQAGKREEAAKQIRLEILNAAAAKEAYKVEAEIKKITDRLKKIAAYSDKHSSVKTRDFGTVQATRSLLAQIGIGAKGEKADDYLELVAKYDPATALLLQDAIKAFGSKGEWQTLPVAELRELAENVNVLWARAKSTREFIVGGERKQMVDVASELVEVLKPFYPKGNLGTAHAVTEQEKLGLSISGMKSIVARIEIWANRTDNVPGVGKLAKYIVNVIKAPEYAYMQHREAELKLLTERLKAIAPLLKPRLIDATEELGYVFGHGPGRSGVAELVAALLHTGNLSNFKRLLLAPRIQTMPDGTEREIRWGALRPDGTLDTTRWDAFIKKQEDAGVLTKELWDFVQGTWDMFERLKPEMQAAHYAVFGKFFAEITTEAFSNRFGNYAGGYVPALTDRDIVHDHDVRDLDLEALGGISRSLPAPASGMTKDRAENYAQPLALDLGLLGMQLNKALLFMHMAAPVSQVQRLVNTTEVKTALDRAFPGARKHMIMPWLARAATHRTSLLSPEFGASGQAWTYLRAATGMSRMMGNVSNTLQQYTGLATATGMLDSKKQMLYAAPALLWIGDLRSKVKQMSPYMNQRMASELSAVAATANEIIMNPSVFQDIRKWTFQHGYFLQQWADIHVSPVVWMAAYNSVKETQPDISEDEARYYADNLVRTSQGATGPTDISTFEAGHPFVQLFTQFTGWGLGQGQAVYSAQAKNFRRDVGLPEKYAKATGITLLMVLVPAMLAEAIALAARGGPEDDDDDGVLIDDWLHQIMIMGPLKFMAGTVPVLGKAILTGANMWNDKPYDDRLSMAPAVSTIEGVLRAPASTYAAIFADGKPSKAIKDASEIGTLFGMPTSVIARPVAYWADVAADRVEPTGPLDAVRGTITGTASPASKR